MSHFKARGRVAFPQARRRATLRLESLEDRTLLSAPEPNNSFAHAYTPTANIYLEQNYYDTDSVSTASDADDYLKFYTLYGNSHLYAALNGLTADADLYVYDQNFNVIASSTAGGNASETINVDLAGFQYVYVRVRAFSGATNYSLYLYNDYAGASLGTARDIGASWGQGNSKYWAYDQFVLQDYLDYRDNVDTFKFTMEAPGTVSLRMKDFTYSGGLIAKMELLDSNGSVLTNTGYGTVGDGLNVDRFTLNSGTYYVRTTQSFGSDPYNLRIVSDYAGDTTATARNLYDLTNTSRQLYDMVGGPFGLPTYEDALDLYRFTLSQTAPVDIALTIPATFTAPTFDADLYLARDTNGDGFIQSGEILNLAATPGNEELHYSALAAGTYYIGVRQNGAYTSYRLDFDSDLDANPGDPAAYKNMSKAPNAGTLIGRHSFSGGFGISAGDFTDFTKFRMSAPGKVSLGAYNSTFLSRTLFTPYVSIIRDANNNQINDPGEVVASGSGSITADLAAGNYYFSLAGDGAQMAYFGQIIADYAGDTLADARNMGATSGPSVTKTFLDNIEQDFGPGSDVDDFYRFVLPSGYAVDLKTTGVAGEDLSLALIRDVNGNGNIDAGDILETSNEANSPTESIVRTLAAGTYFARVRGLNGETNYKLTAKFTAQASPPGDPDDTISEANGLASQLIALDGSVDGTLDVRDDVDMFRFTVTAGQRVSFDLDPRLGSSLDTYVRLFKSNGALLAENNDGGAQGEGNTKFSYLEYVFAQGGTYYLGVSLNPNKNYSPTNGSGDVQGANTLGAYRLTLNNLGKTTPTLRRVNAGGASYIDANGRYFEADQGFTGGSKTNVAFPVNATTEDPLFYAYRLGNSFSYARPMANGTYSLSLYFADPTSTAIGQRKFNVTAEGAALLTNFDIYKVAAGAKKAVIRTFTVTVTDGQMNLAFTGVVGQAIVSAISMVKI